MQVPALESSAWFSRWLQPSGCCGSVAGHTHLLAGRDRLVQRLRTAEGKAGEGRAQNCPPPPGQRRFDEPLRQAAAAGQWRTTGGALCTPLRYTKALLNLSWVNPSVHSVHSFGCHRSCCRCWRLDGARWLGLQFAGTNPLWPPWTAHRDHKHASCVHSTQAGKQSKPTRRGRQAGPHPAWGATQPATDRRRRHSWPAAGSLAAASALLLIRVGAAVRV